MKRGVKYSKGWSDIFEEGERVQLRKTSPSRKGVYSRASETELWSDLKEASSLKGKRIGIMQMEEITL